MRRLRHQPAWMHARLDPGHLHACVLTCASTLGAHAWSKKSLAVTCGLLLCAIRPTLGAGPIIGAAAEHRARAGKAQETGSKLQRGDVVATGPDREHAGSVVISAVSAMWSHKSGKGEECGAHAFRRASCTLSLSLLSDFSQDG
jgi:hypothetical protein